MIARGALMAVIVRGVVRIGDMIARMLLRRRVRLFAAMPVRVVRVVAVRGGSAAQMDAALDAGLGEAPEATSAGPRKAEPVVQTVEVVKEVIRDSSPARADSRTIGISFVAGSARSAARSARAAPAIDERAVWRQSQAGVAPLKAHKKR